LGPSFGPDSAGSIVALSVMIYSASAGFLFAYLASRIYLRACLSEMIQKKQVNEALALDLSTELSPASDMFA
jgi:uncharacterized membrane protein YdjX (TVP38/TMEM64 family)